MDYLATIMSYLVTFTHIALLGNPIFPSKLQRTFTSYRQNFSNDLSSNMGLGFSISYRTKKMTQKNANYSNAFVLVLILEGKSIYTDHTNKKYALKPGNGFLRIPKKSHTYEIFAEQTYSEAFIHVPESFYSDIKKYGGSNENHPVIQFDLKSKLLETMLDTALILDKVKENSLPIYLLELYGFIIKFCQQSNLNTIPSFHLKLVEEVCGILDDTLTQNVKLPEIAKGFNISYERLRKVFKEVMHVSMGEYRIKSRIQHAQTLLLKREMNINEIAEHMGYPDSFTFSKQFKKERGMSPEKYLKNLLY